MNVQQRKRISRRSDLPQHTYSIADKASDLLGYREGDQEMMTGQLALGLIDQPLIALMVLTVGTMAVSAAAVYHVVFFAFCAAIDGCPIMVSAAVNDGIDDFAVVHGHCIAKALDILRAISCKDFLNYRHGRLLSSAH